MIQNWQKKGCIFNVNEYDSKLNYSAVPFGFWINNTVMRIYFSARNNKNQSIPCFFEFDFETMQVVRFVTKLGIEHGELGTFDDSGVMPSCLLKQDDKIYLYYIGWNLGQTVPFRNSIGLAISYDNGETFEKMFKGPILDRTKDEPHFCASSDVLFENGSYKMWYLNCTKWELINNSMRHFYHIKYATSIDGINWKREGKVAIDFKNVNEYAISVPRVIMEDNIYKMWYSYRGGYQNDKYKIGYAESQNGEDWIRKDELIKLSESTSNWDSDMQCYPFIFDYNGKKMMLYNGNDYGKTGIGIAELIN